MSSIDWPTCESYRNHEYQKYSENQYFRRKLIFKNNKPQKNKVYEN